jgi:hypothetical protein
VRERFKLRILESFGPVTQEKISASPATIHTQASRDTESKDQSEL